MNTIPKLIAFNLSTLSTMMLCVSVNTWASDIEIYQAANPADGKATVMFALDVSSFMHHDIQNAGGGKPITYDYGIECKSTEVDEKYTATAAAGGLEYTYKAYYCPVYKKVKQEPGQLDQIYYVQKSTDNFNQRIDLKYNTKIENYCKPQTGSTEYRCYDRFTMLKRSLFQAIDKAGPGLSFGFSFFPALSSVQAPLAMGNSDGTINLTNKNRLFEIVRGLTPSNDINVSKIVDVGKGYSNGAYSLIKDRTVAQCTGYGVFALTAGNPFQDDLIHAKNTTNSVLTSPLLTDTDCNPNAGSGNSSTGGASWKCVSAAANYLANNQSLLKTPVKTAVVGMGATFDFEKLALSAEDKLDYTPTLTTTQIQTYLTAALKTVNDNSTQDLYKDIAGAANTGVLGGGGFYSAFASDQLVTIIDNFIKLVADAKIPALTTGTVTIPQDPLNTSVVRDQSYYPQFKPTPDYPYQLWAGNVKKYKVTTQGQLVDKNANFVFDKAGLLKDNYDFWSPDVDPALSLTDPETMPGSTLFALMGGARSKLAERTAANTIVVNRNLLTNRQVDSSGVSSEVTTLNPINIDYIKTADPYRGYLISLLGYEVDATKPNEITLDSLTPKLPQIGAVMHSSPLLFTNKGKIDYSGNALTADNREDYVLFGTTQGLLHVVKAGGKPKVTVTENLDGTTSTTETPDPDGGKEVFAFVPNEMVNKQKEAFLKPSATSGGLNRLFYGIDAPWTAYTQYVLDIDGNLTVGKGRNYDEKDNPTDVGKQLLYGGLRMGGRSYYSLNLQDVTKPQINFHIDPASKKVYANGNSSPKIFDELAFMGQSWSKPKIAWVKLGGERKLVMFVGGGYDAGGADGDANNGGYENDDYNQENGIGAGVYMFDALNGDLLWWASSNKVGTRSAGAVENVIHLEDSNLKYSVATEIKTADRNNDGLIDHLYFGDLAGQVFRIDLDNMATTTESFAKRSVRLLDLRHFDDKGALDGKSPRFYDAPAFSTYKNTDGSLFAVISIGSGNRSHPLANYQNLDGSKTNYDPNRDYDAIYNIYDKDVTSKYLYQNDYVLQTQNIGKSGTTNALVELTDSDRFPNTNPIVFKAPYATKPGWYYQFKSGNLFQSEKVMGIPIVIDSDLYVSTYDQSKTGLTGTCGGGVKGTSALTAFCLPFGQCATGSVETYRLNLGVGIVGAAVGTGDSAGLSRLLVPNVDTSGLVNATNNKILSSEYTTRIHLTPQRWYER